jgi:hypothetical protein
MKKLAIILLSSIVLLNTSCLKDKGLDNFEYGIKDPALSSPPGVGFNLQGGANYVKNIGLDVSASSQTINPSATVIGYFFNSTVTAEDVQAKLSVDNTILTDYDATSGSDPLEILDPALYHIASTDINIVKGTQNASVGITLDSTTSLDPNKKYAIGLRIISASNGITIAKNMDKCLLILSIKNRFDGVYELTFSNSHPSLNPNYDGDVTEVELQTTGPNSCKIYWPLAGKFANPAVLSGGLSYFGNQEPEYTIDPVTNKVTVQNAFVGATTFYTMNPTFDSHYDPTTKILVARWGYSYVGGQFDPTASREWTQSFKYLGPR